MSPGVMRGDTGVLANEIYLANPIVSSKQQLSGLKTTNCGLLICLVKLRRHILLNFRVHIRLLKKGASA